MRALLVLGLVGCYDPHPSPGAPCSDTQPCPLEQTCVAGTCRLSTGGGSDAPIDGPVNDMDRDGIADEVDNCPNIANTDQANEDGDKFGDACDPCPIVANDSPVDSDGDSVSDDCDPHPATAGDKLVAFDGFKDGVVSSTFHTLGQIEAAAPDVSLVSTLANHAAILAPDAGFTNGTITATVNVAATLNTSFTGLFVAILNGDTGDSIQCGFYQDDVTMPGTKQLDLYSTLINNGMGGDIKANNFAWANGTTYKIVLTKQGNNYTCSETPLGGATMTVSGSSGSFPANAFPAILNFNQTSHASYLMVVTSP